MIYFFYQPCVRQTKQILHVIEFDFAIIATENSIKDLVKTTAEKASGVCHPLDPFTLLMLSSHGRTIQSGRLRCCGAPFRWMESDLFCA